MRFAPPCCRWRGIATIKLDTLAMINQFVDRVCSGFGAFWSGHAGDMIATDALARGHIGPEEERQRNPGSRNAASHLLGTRRALPRRALGANAWIDRALY